MNISSKEYKEYSEIIVVGYHLKMILNIRYMKLEMENELNCSVITSG